MCVTRISLGLMINAGMIFEFNQEAHLRWTCDRSRVNWEEFVRCQVRANETNSEAKRQCSDRNSAVGNSSGVPQGCVLCPLLFFLYTSGLFSILENKLIIKLMTLL